MSLKGQYHSPPPPQKEKFYLDGYPKKIIYCFDNISL